MSEPMTEARLDAAPVGAMVLVVPSYMRDAAQIGTLWRKRQSGAWENKHSAEWSARTFFTPVGGAPCRITPVQLGWPEEER